MIEAVRRETMRRRFWVLLIILLALLAEESTSGAQVAKVYRVGILSMISPDRPQIKGLRDGLREAGYIEGKNLLFHMPVSRTVTELEVVAKSYIDSKIDVIVTTGGVETGVARDATRDIPTVFMPVTDPVESGFVKSVPHPGTNMTGIAFTGDVREQGKQLELFKEIVPTLSRIVVLYDSRHPAATMNLREVRRVARHLGIELLELPVTSITEAEQAASSIRGAKLTGIHLICTSLFADPTKPAVIAKAKRIPFHSCTNDHVVNGAALFAYARDFYSIGRRGAWYVDRILKGDSPDKLPVETAMKYELVINLKTAKEIGLTIPPEVLMRATTVVK